MDETRARKMIEEHFAASGIARRAGARATTSPAPRRSMPTTPCSNGRRAASASGARPTSSRSRSAYPARLEFEVHRTIGRQDLWVNEYTIRYDGKPVLAVGIMEFQDDKVVRERIYFGDPWDPPAWRAQWVERMDGP